MPEIKLNRRYPDSRPEDITDAYMRGFEVGLAMRTDENAKLRELARTLYMCSRVRCDQCEYEHENTCDFDIEGEVRHLGVEV